MLPYRSLSCHHARPTDFPFVVVIQPNPVVPSRGRTPFADTHAAKNAVQCQGFARLSAPGHRSVNTCPVPGGWRLCC